MKDRFVVVVTTTPTLHEATRELASRLAARTNAVLLFLHVVPMQAADGEAMLYSALAFSSGEGEAWLARQRPSAAGVRFRHHLVMGEPEDATAAFVADHDVDLLIVEEPPRNLVAVALWRSFAERLVRRVHCPVLIGGPEFLRAAPPSRVPASRGLPQPRLADLLNALVDARADALRAWMDHAADAAARAAASNTVRVVAQSAARANLRVDPADARRLEVELDEHVRALRGVGWQLVVGSQRWGEARIVPAPSSALVAFLARVEALGHSASVPLLCADDPERLLVLAGARVPGEAGGALIFSFDAEDDFLRILGQPGPVPSFETYAFDRDGVMLSNSRFPEYLWRAGLLASDGLQTPLRVRVAEPSDGPVEDWPLTHMVKRALQRGDGWDTRGYLDYRGMSVVGAWRWLSGYDFGVAAEVDRGATLG